MGKAISGALSLALIILVLRWALPEIADPLVEIITKILEIILNVINQASIPQIHPAP